MAHYYSLEGESRHEIVGKNGKTRPTDIRDARKLGLFPSVSTVKETGAAYNLVNWMLNLLLDQTIVKPFHPDEFEIDEYKKMVFSMYNRQKEAPALKGNEVHAIMDKWFIDGTDDGVYVPKVVALLGREFPGYTWWSEQSFVHPSGYAGRVDLWGRGADNKCVVVDFKTKDKEDIGSIAAYDDYKMQLVAYQKGLNLPDENTRRFNCFISVAKGFEGDCALVESKDLDKYWNMFNALFSFWKVKNGYDPSINYSNMC